MSSRARELCRQARAEGMRADWRAAPGLGALLIGGADGAAFLQAQLTSDVAALAPGEGQLSARLDRKGALVAWFSLHRLPDRGQPAPTYLALLPRAEIAGLITDLERFVVALDVLLEDVSDEFDGEVVQGAVAAPLAAGRPDLAVAADGEGFVVVRSWTGDPGCLVLTPRGAPGAAADPSPWDDDEDARLAWSWLLVEAGVLRVGRDFEAGRRVLPETGLETRTVSTTKGCYLGQEVVARIRTYGSTALALRGLLLDGTGLPAFPAPGEPVLTPDRGRIGVWASSGWSVALEAPVALAFLDREHRTPGTRIEAVLTDGGTAAAEVRTPPFHDAAGDAAGARHLHERAVHAFSHGRDDEAVALLEEALRRDPGLREAYEALGVILGRLERFHAAIDVFRRLEEIAPDEPMVHTNLSLFYMKIGDRDEAERQKEQATLKRFAGLDAQREADEQAAAAAAARRDDAQRKLVMYGQVLELDPDDPLALAGTGSALLALERVDEAEPYLARALAAQPDNSALHLTHGRVLERLDRADEAAGTYRRGVAAASRKGDLMPLREMEHRLLLLNASGALAAGRNADEAAS